MNITQIYTKRRRFKQKYAQQIINEWEDIISNELNIPVVSYPISYRVINKLQIHPSFIEPSKKTFRFVINGRDYDCLMNNECIVPCVIDFFEKENQLQEFYSKHTKNKITLLSSPFDYEYLKKNNCPLNVGLFAFSLPDKYAFSKKPLKKKYDIVLTGRQDPLLYSFFKEYIKQHPNVTYVKRGQEIENDVNKTKKYYINGKECLGTLESREEFINLQSQGRVTLYGTQGYDCSTKGFYHMTPHFLEIIACGCHVLAHYPTGEDGVDAKYYEFDKFSPSIETYEEFEMAMDKALNSDIDAEMYSSYLKKHYTSTRVNNLKKILQNL